MRRPIWAWLAAASLTGVLVHALTALPSAAPDRLTAARTPAPAPSARRLAVAAPLARSGPLHRTASTNWAGYAVSGARFSAVKASWRQPAADCAAVPHSEVTLASFWVGLDGYGRSRTVQQIGTESGCEGGTPAYYAWLELYPNHLAVLASPRHAVHAGDLLHAEVRAGVLRLRDATAGWTVRRRFATAGLPFSSAECIAEAPVHGLTDFGAVSFADATATTAAAGRHPLDGGVWPLHRVTLTGGSGAGTHALARARPDAVSELPSGSSFAVSWLHR